MQDGISINKTVCLSNYSTNSQFVEVCCPWNIFFSFITNAGSKAANLFTAPETRLEAHFGDNEPYRRENDNTNWGRVSVQPEKQN